MVHWIVVLSFLNPQGQVVTSDSTRMYETREACEKMKPIELMHVLDVFKKYHVKLISVDCLPGTTPTN